jgi:hypothetical protein
MKPFNLFYVSFDRQSLSKEKALIDEQALSWGDMMRLR